MNIASDIYDLALMLFVGFALGALTTISVQDLMPFFERFAIRHQRRQ